MELDDAPTAALDVPTPQGVHVADPGTIYVPAIQGTQVEDEEAPIVVLIVPSAQGLHDVFPISS